MEYENMDTKTLVKLLIEKDNRIKKLCLEKEKLSYYARVDVMTGVLNRRSGLELLDKEFNSSKTNNENLVVCFVDVDRLKIINDTFGHEEGDRILITVGKVLKESIRKTDFVIRLGGDEFLVVFPQTAMKDVNKAWYRICKRVDEFNRETDNYNLSLSYGFYEYGKEIEKEMSIKELIKRADMDMYKEKMKKKRNFADICIINKKKEK